MDQHTGLNGVDLLVIVVILISGALALWRGFVRECLSLAAWAGAAAVTAYFYPSLRPWMHQHIKGGDFVADAATGLVLFCGALIVFIPIGYILAGLGQGRALTAIDRSLGFIFGLARGVLVVCLLFLLTLWIWPEKEKEPEMLAQARSRPFLAYGAEYMKSFLPQDDLKKVEDHMHGMAEKAADKADAIAIDRIPSVDATTTGASDVAPKGPSSPPSVEPPKPAAKP